MERRLVAILAADVVGYSRLISADEIGALAQLSKLRRDIIEPNIVNHSGRLFKVMGDGFLAEFASAVQATSCAIAIQKEAEAVSAGLDDEKRMRLRIGIHVGDVMVDGDDLMGDGVNIAARLESVAMVGGISISRAVHDQIRDRIEAAFDDEGEVALKNIPRPVQVFAFSRAKRATLIKLPIPDKPSIAVLPFQNMSGDPEQEYFADGVVEDIITALSRVKSFFVIARNSSFTYKGRAVDLRQVGNELGVRYILEGSVRKAGIAVRISGQLLEASTGNHIWADKFDGDLNQIFELQDRITESVVTSIEPSIRNSEIQRSRNKPPESLTAYDLYLRAQPEFHSYTRDGFLRARELLERAVTIDPNFSDAWASLADCLGRLLVGGWFEAIEQGRELVCETALKAVHIDPQNGQALAMAAWALALAGNNAERGAEFAEQALKIHPNSAYVRTMSAYGFLYAEQFEKARRNFEAALRFSPLDVRGYTMLIGIANCDLYTRNFPEAIRWAERAVEKGPTFGVALRVLTAALALDGRVNDAKRSCKTLLSAHPNSSISMLRRRPAGSPWMTELLLDGLRRAGLPE